MKALLEGNTARLVFALVLSVLSFAFAGALMFTSGYMISLAATLPLTVLALHLPSLFVRIFGIGKPVLQYLYRLSSHDWVLRMTSRLRLRLYDALRKRTSALAGRERTGSILSMLVDDIGHAQDLVLRGVLPIAGAWLVAIFALVLAGVLSAWLACALALSLVIALVLLPCVVARANAGRLAKAKELDRALYEELTDDVLGIADWTLSGNQDACIARACATQAQRQSVERSMRRARRVNDLIAQVLFGVCVIALVVWAASAFGSARELGGLAGAMASSVALNAEAYPPNWIAAFALCLFPLIEAFAPVEVALEDYIVQRGVLARIDEFADCEEDEHASVPEPHGYDIDIAGLRFAYDEGGSALFDGFDLHVPQGKKLAVLGTSGVGKTTLAALLHGDVRPSRGTVTIGDVDAWELRSRMERIVGIVEQSPYLFDMTLRDNLLVARPDASDDDIIAALRAVELGRLLDGLEHGLDTRVQERGARFSGGERHRIALARVLLAGQPIVILDEPFANIDRPTEERLLDTVLATMADKTVIMITHHAHDVARFDDAVVLE